ncbi:hypothetical protein [Algoriphagus namhaensis]
MSTATTQHSFHIPVMGLGYTVDSPIKVARYGISSVVSIMDDHLLEDMRRMYCRKNQLEYIELKDNGKNSRSERITSYLNLIHDLVTDQMKELHKADWNTDLEFKKYLDLLPENHPIHSLLPIFQKAEGAEKKELARKIKSSMVPGAIDVNIMTKVDKINFDREGNELPRQYSDALSALKGFADSKVKGSVIFSAGMNPALFGYAEEFDCFSPDQTGNIQKGIVLKVSDYRSALIQGKFLAKKGLFVSEFRIESGLNCGGHAFATDGYLIGPILEEFKSNKKSLYDTIYETCQEALHASGKNQLIEPHLKITYQGGLGTAEEDSFLREYYQLDGTGWGSPFLLVPEATSVDSDTLQRILASKKSDYYLSNASPLGVPFNNLKNSSGEEQRKKRIAKNRPGSPCYKKFLSFSKEFTDTPICTASRQYQNLKTKQFQNQKITQEDLREVLEKDCLCEGLSAPAILAGGENPRRNLSAVTLCPGPNLAYFKGTFSLREMMDHIYGKIKINLDAERPHVFVKELELYVSYLKAEFEKLRKDSTTKKESYLRKFSTNLHQGIQYYQQLADTVSLDSEEILDRMKSRFKQLQTEIDTLHTSFSPSLAQS